MAAVVLEHEKPQQKSGRRHDQNHAWPELKIEGKPGPEPKQQERYDCDCKLIDGATYIRLSIFCEDLQPSFFI
ncbi:hypothetical protein HNQ72_005027 [Rhizobium wenxiniae]|uniref:Uncharacterized protein n=1 Tax=Rhizobium wenxiniae TaxID=1737357 RepID=A0A7W9YAS6_9HYPH|nr:hypothetical protein [Rhizobium wenxiniae]